MNKFQPRAFIADMHTVAELIETGANLPPAMVQVDYDGGRVSYNFWDDDAAAQIAAARRLFPGIKFTKNNPATGSYDETYYRLTGKLEYGTAIEFIAHRSTVCNRVVTGTETITEELPDPAEVAKLPTVKHQRTIETVEWQCVPMLAKAEAVKS